MHFTAPLIRWAGSKRLSLPQLIQFVPQSIKRYIEPFCGSSALYYQLSDKAAILSDINRDLINFYQIIQQRASKIYDIATSIPRDAETYYQCRQEFNVSNDKFARAWLFYYLNKNCFNGLYRTSKLGNFNVPFSPTRTGNYPARERFVSTARLLRRAKFKCVDFEPVIAQCGKGDFVYLDPPIQRPLDIHSGSTIPVRSQSVILTDLQSLSKNLMAGAAHLCSLSPTELRLHIVHWDGGPIQSELAATFRDLPEEERSLKILS